MANIYKISEFYVVHHIILNQIYDILVELQNQDIKIILCEVPEVHIGIKRNNEADKAIDIPEMTTKRVLFTNYYLTIMRARNFEW